MWLDAQTDGRRELAIVSGDIGSAVVIVRGPTPEAVLVAGARVETGTAVEVNPGRLEVEVRARDGAHRRTVEVRTGERVRIEFDLTSPLAPPAEAVPAASQAGRFAGIVVAAVGGALVGTGSITGGLALAAASDARRKLPSTCNSALACPKTDQPTIDQTYAPARNLAYATDSLLVLGSVAVIAGVVIAVVNPGASRVRASGAGVALSFD
ncbi:MAG: hypothetical protein U0414_37725 [Polyangiaceae bacterium]